MEVVQIMKPIDGILKMILAPLVGVALLGLMLPVQPATAKTTQTAPSPPATYPALPSETPAKFEPVTDSFDYLNRDVMIPMRDGVKLHTVILVPRGAKSAPILLTRTPYDATELTSPTQSSAANARVNAPEVKTSSTHPA